MTTLTTPIRDLPKRRAAELDASGPVISARGVVKRYGAHTAVDGVDFTVTAGETFVLLGPNGAGKTTLVEMLEANRRRDAGTLTVLGLDPDRADRRWRARIGVVLQTARDHAEFRVGELLHHIGAFYPRRQDTEALLATVGLNEKRDALVRTLSGGQRRRLDVALGVVGRPELLFLDEPTTGFDPEARRHFWEMLDGLRGTGTTIVLTTHDLVEAERLADRVAVLVDGRFAFLGGAGDLRSRHPGRSRVSWSEPGGRREREVTDVTGLLGELRARFGEAIPDLEIQRPSLEDMYLELLEEGR